MSETNKLNKENSLYLRQHADNPVFWYPWCDEAFHDAKKFNKPIMLSIGYSACHWCHVMAHESFEDQDTADILNDSFINIKVDREERPDIDKIYQMSQSIITGKNGGWPLTIFMDHNKFPFFGGTYFPKEDKYGMLSFKKILARVLDFYINNKEEIKAQNVNVLEVFNKLQERESQEDNINADTIAKLKNQLNSITDTINGGFGSAPKFPHFPSLSFSIANCSSDLDRKKIKYTLDRMCVSGINDPVDGGFFRYSVDDLWMIPHFEKMLYDNGPMMSVLCDSHAVFDDSFYLKKANEIFKWVNNFMTSEHGGFYSTIDADSEGEEGKYYVFSQKELKENFNEEDFKLINEYFTDSGKTNFEGSHHLHVYRKKELVFKKDINIFENIMNKLCELRKDKIMPGIDTKILLSWNCLYIKGLIKLYKISNNKNVLKVIDKSFEFIFKSMVTDKVIYSCFNGKACFPGYLDDYALLVSSLIDYLSIQWSDKHYELSKRVCEDLITIFEDKKKGGYFFTSNNHEKLFYRPKSISDDSVPSGLVYATDALLQMGYLSGDQRFIDSADRSINYVRKSFGDNMTSNVSAINLLHDKNIEREIIIVRCSEPSWNEIIKEKAYYDKFILYINNDYKDLPDAIEFKKPQGDFSAYICQGMSCLKPITNLKDFITHLHV
jgi:uncharacterized protein YyaL (SSP411 family)